MNKSKYNNKISELNLYTCDKTDNTHNNSDEHHNDISTLVNCNKPNSDFWNNFEHTLFVSQLIIYVLSNHIPQLSPIELFILLQVQLQPKFTMQDIKKLAHKYHYKTSVLAFYFNLLTQKKLLTCVDNRNSIQYSINKKTDAVLLHIQKSAKLQKLLNKLNPVIQQILNILQ